MASYALIRFCVQFANTLNPVDLHFNTFASLSLKTIPAKGWPRQCGWGLYLTIGLARAGFDVLRRDCNIAHIFTMGFQTTLTTTSGLRRATTEATIADTASATMIKDIAWTSTA